MKLFKVFFLAIGLIGFNSFAQDVAVGELPTATIADNYYVTLDPSVPIQDFYVADITHLGFTSSEEGQNLLNIYVNGNLIDAELHLEEGYAIVHIHTEYFGEGVTYEGLQNYLDHLTKPE